jgi:hypothetical protein
MRATQQRQCTSAVLLNRQTRMKSSLLCLTIRPQWLQQFRIGLGFIFVCVLPFLAPVASRDFVAFRPGQAPLCLISHRDLVCGSCYAGPAAGVEEPGCGRAPTPPCGGGGMPFATIELAVIEPSSSHRSCPIWRLNAGSASMRSATRSMRYITAV